MGNIRPQELRDIESLVWNTVLKIARGEAQAPEALEELMSGIPWHIVEAWGPEDPNRTWFRPGNSLFPTTWLTCLICGFNTASMSLATENPTNGGIRKGLLLSAMNSSRQKAIPSSESHSSGVDLGVEGSACGEGSMRAKSVGPENDGGSHRDVNMEDGESGHYTRTLVPGLGDRDVTMEDGESRPEPNITAPRLEENDARKVTEPEDAGRSPRDGPEDPDPDVTMANAESGVARATEEMPVESNRQDLVGNEPQNLTGPLETRFSHRLREAVTTAQASGPPSAPEGDLDEDNKKTAAGPRRGKKKEPATRQKRAPSLPLGLWEIIDVDALVRWSRAMNLIWS
jgi:hypothetical protein